MIKNIKNENQFLLIVDSYFSVFRLFSIWFWDILKARDGNAQLEEQYRNELIAQEKLLELYKVVNVLILMY